jgi:hypothetical protein
MRRPAAGTDIRDEPAGQADRAQVKALDAIEDDEAALCGCVQNLA